MKDQKIKEEIIEIFGSQIRFNKNFEEHIDELKEGMITDFLEWCKRCKENKELGSVPPRKEFKHLYVFFRKIGSSIRTILIKEQNKYFIDIIIEDHKGYDDMRLKLGYKQSSYYGS